MFSAELFTDAVDPLNGSVAFTLPLLDIPGPESLNINLSLTYSSLVQDTVQHWNLSHPTSCIGLGWELPRWRIFVDQPYGVDLAEQRILLSTPATLTRLTYLNSTEDGTQQWLAEKQPFWQIRFNPSNNRWLVIDENGIRHQFGGAGGTETAVAIGDWLASSQQTHSQRQVAVVWNRVAVSDLFNNTINFEYQNVNSSLGVNGQAYTQASYLSAIVGAYGDRVTLNYADKSPDEYAWPFTDPNPPNAYQARVATRYLSSLVFQPAMATTPSGTITLNSDTQFIGGDRSAAFTKRTLNQIVRSYIDGRALPPLSFNYADNSAALPGALTSVTLPAGGTINYTYARAGGSSGVLQYSQRDIALTAPSIAAVTYSNPNLYFADNYVVVTWQGDDQSIAIAPYRWEGRWLAGSITTIANAYSGSEQIAVSLAPDLFAVYAAGQLMCCYQDPQTPDGWIAPDSPFTPGLSAGEPISGLVSGDRFVALLGATSGTLCRFDFTNLSWSAATPTTPISLSNPVATQLLAQGNSILIGAVSTRTLAVVLLLRGLDGDWRQDTAQQNWTGGSNPTLYAALGSAGAIFAAASQFGNLDSATAYACQWQIDQTTPTLQLTQLMSSNTALNSELVSAHGMTLRMANLLWRYDGVDWIAADLASLGLADGEQLSDLSVAVDLAVRSISQGGNISRFDLVSFDANSGAWSARTSVQPPAEGTGVGVAPSTRNQASRYAVLGNSLYYMNSDLSWAVADGVQPISVDPSQAPSVTVAENELLLYQSGADADTNVTVGFLGNGGLMQDPVSVSGSVLIPAQPAHALIGNRAFAAYTGTWDGADFSLKLYRPVAYDIRKQQTAIVVASVVADAGYQPENVTIPGVDSGTVALEGPTAMAYDFDTNAATVQADGLAALFNHITTYPGSTTAAPAAAGQTDSYRFNGLSSSETPAKTPPPNDNYTNANGLSALTVGVPYAASAAKVDAQVSTEIRNTVEYAWVSLKGTANGWSVNVRQRQQIDTLDGVSKTRTTTYDDNTGLPTQATDDNVAADGSTIIRTTSYQYFWQQYDPDRQLNLLTPIIQITNQAQQGEADPVPIDSQVNTWRSGWPSGASGWGLSASYRRTQNNAADFNAWQPGETPPAGWQQTFAVLERAANGAILTSSDTLSNLQGSQYDRDMRVETASCGNGAPGDFTYFGFEAYESPAAWVAINGYLMDKLIITADSHTGEQCAQLPAGSNDGALFSPFAPSDINARYLFSCWSRPLAGFDQGQGLATANIVLYWTESGSPQSAALGSLNLGTTAGPWAYRQIMLDFAAAYNGATPDDNSVYATVTISNANSATAVNIDELRLSPLLGEFTATVYNMATLLPTASIDSNGQSHKTLYDDLLRPFVNIGPLATVQSIETSGFSSQQGGAGSFQSNTPNALFKLTPGTSSSYDDFRSDSLSNWDLNNAGGSWSISNGALQYSGGSGSGIGGSASPKTSNSENFAAWVQVQPGTGSGAALGDGNVYLLWTPASEQSGKFAFVSVDDAGALTTLQQTATLNFASDWLFVAIDGLYYAAVDGVPILAIEMDSAPSSGELTLAATTAASFDNLVRMDEPSLTVSFTDGLGRNLQNVSIEGRTGSDGDNSISVLVSGVLHDTAGRPMLQRQPLTAKIGLSDASGSAPQYLLGTPTEYIVQPNGPSDSLQDYLSNGLDQILTYLTEQYEQSPLARLIQTISPRPSSAGSGTGYTSNINYGATTSPTPPNGDSEDSGDFYLQETQTQVALGTAPETVITELNGEITDKAGNTLLTYRGPVDGPYLQQQMSYDAAGRLQTVTEANGVGAAEQDGPNYTQTFAYDDLQRVVSATGPDAGQVQVMYDSVDRIRFSMDAAGAAAKLGGNNVQKIRYYRYDTLGRVIESGYIQDTAYQWGNALVAKLNDQSFPKVSGGGGSGTLINGVWRVLQYYDTDGTAETQGLLGRLWQSKTQTDAGDGLIVRNFSYDVFGNPITTTETVPWGAPGSEADSSTSTTSYGYTNDGQLASITYPTLDENSISVGYFYDRVGRYAGVGIPISGGEIIDPTQPVPATAVRYAGYQYDDSGRLANVAYNRPPAAATAAFTRQYGYDDDSRLSSLTDPYIAINLSYQEQDGTDSTDARLAQFDLQYQLSELWPNPPTAVQYQYDYDSYGRITSATTGLSDAYSFRSAATGSPGGYDNNGNRQQTQHGVTGYQYQYTSDDATPANGITSITPSIAVSEDFEDASGNRAGVWTWGSNNGGPSNSKLSSNNPHSGSQCLKLSGGNQLGHREILVLDSYLEPNAVLSLTVWVRTANGYRGEPGNQAFWRLDIYGFNGIMATQTLATVDANSDWTEQTVAVDVAGICAALCLQQAVTRCRLSLVNASYRSNGNSGYAVFVDDLGLNWTSPPSWAIGHDANGNVDALPQRQLNLTYDTFVTRPLTAQLDATTVNWLYDSGGLARRQQIDTISQDQRNYYDLSGNLIARQTIKDQEVTTSYFINGPTGLLASQINDNLAFALSDQFGSLRALIDGDSQQPIAAFDFATFGQLMRSSTEDLSSVRFIRNARDATTGLIIAPDQLYDSELGRYLIAQAQAGNLVPYIIDQNDPLNWKNIALSAGIGLSAILASSALIAFFFPGALTAAAGAATAAATAAGNFAVEYGGYTLALGAMFSPLIQDPSFATLGDIGLGNISNLAALYTAVPLYQFASLYIPFAGPVTQILTGIGAVATQGAAAAAYKYFADSYISGTAMDEQQQGGVFDHAVRGAIFGILGHAILNRGNFASAAVTRANYQGPKTHELYLKFPRIRWNQWNHADMWRGFIKGMVVPYKGITSGRQSPLFNVAKRHGDHHWNQYGYGFAIPILSSANEDAIKYAEMLLIGTLGGATRLTGAGAGVTQQLYTPGTLTPARRQAFIDAFITRNFDNTINPLHALQYWFQQSAYAETWINIPLPSVQWREVQLG